MENVSSAVTVESASNCWHIRNSLFTIHDCRAMVKCKCVKVMVNLTYRHTCRAVGLYHLSRRELQPTKKPQKCRISLQGVKSAVWGQWCFSSAVVDLWQGRRVADLRLHAHRGRTPNWRGYGDRIRLNQNQRICETHPRANHIISLSMVPGKQTNCATAIPYLSYHAVSLYRARGVHTCTYDVVETSRWRRQQDNPMTVIWKPLAISGAMSSLYNRQKLKLVQTRLRRKGLLKRKVWI